MRSYRLFVAVFAAVCGVFAAFGATAIDWVGGGADNLTTTLANWSIGGETPTELPDLTGGTLAVTIKGGTGLMYSDNDKFYSIVNDLGATDEDGAPFTIEPAAVGAKLKIVDKIESIQKRQLVVRGHLTYDGTTAPTFKFDEASGDNPAPSAMIKGTAYASKSWSAKLVLDNVIIDLKMVRRRATSQNNFHVLENTFNVINGYWDFGGNQAGGSFGAGSVIEMRGGFTASNFFHYEGKGECRLFGDSSVSFSTGCQNEGVKVVLATCENKFNVLGNEQL